MPTMERFPEDVTREIMLHLPPESLIQFKLVSKSWCALIKSFIGDREFADKNLRIMKTTSYSTSFAFIHHPSCTCGIHLAYGFIFERRHPPSCPAHKTPYLLTYFHKDGVGQKRDNFRCATDDFWLPRLRDNIIAGHVWPYHCDGLICFCEIGSKTNYSYFLCNPTIKEVRPLPKPILFDHFEQKGAGLSYDSTSDDYKFVAFGYNLESFDPKAEIYSLNYDCWREIGFDWTGLIDDYNITDEWDVDSQALCRGVFYWSTSHHYNSIISFDVANEKFHELPVPSRLRGLPPWEPDEFKLMVWNESVALIYYYEEDEMKPIEIWVMQDCVFGDVKGSCTWVWKLRILRPNIGILRPLVLFKGDELLLKDRFPRLIYYNFDSKRWRILANAIQTEYFAFVYIRSLISVYRRK